MKKLNFWGLVKLAITLIKLWKDHKDELQAIFEELKSIIKNIKSGTYSKVSVKTLSVCRLGGGGIEKTVNLSVKHDKLA
jgi:hypothetical protein